MAPLQTPAAESVTAPGPTIAGLQQHGAAVDKINNAVIERDNSTMETTVNQLPLMPGEPLITTPAAAPITYQDQAAPSRYTSVYFDDASGSKVQTAELRSHNAQNASNATPSANQTAILEGSEQANRSSADSVLHAPTSEVQSQQNSDELLPPPLYQDQTKTEASAQDLTDNETTLSASDNRDKPGVLEADQTADGVSSLLPPPPPPPMPPPPPPTMSDDLEISNSFDDAADYADVSDAASVYLDQPGDPANNVAEAETTSQTPNSLDEPTPTEAQTPPKPLDTSTAGGIAGEDASVIGTADNVLTEPIVYSEDSQNFDALAAGTTDYTDSDSTDVLQNVQQEDSN